MNDAAVAGAPTAASGASEVLLDGTDGSLDMAFEPHRPETSCTIRMHWKPQ